MGWVAGCRGFGASGYWVQGVGVLKSRGWGSGCQRFRLRVPRPQEFRKASCFTPSQLFVFLATTFLPRCCFSNFFPHVSAAVNMQSLSSVLMVGDGRALEESNSWHPQLRQGAA